MNIKQKALRELTRPFQQLMDRISVARAIVRRKHYDAFVRKKVTQIPGRLQRGRNVVVVLIYQPDGLLNSLFHTLQHFVENDISPLIVVNHPLTEDQIARLKDLSHLIITRPNIGYDFAGYREGILTVFETGPVPENIFLINDSIWFPVRDNCTLLETALAAKEDVFGIFYNTSYNNRTLHHLPSFFYRFNTKTLRSKSFRRFWKSIPFFQDKSLVIRFIEMKATSYFAKRNFSIGSEFNAEDIKKAALSLGVDQKVRVARYFAATKPAGNKIFGAHTEQRSDLDKTLIDLMSNTRFRFFYIDNHPFVFLENLKSPVIKKNREYRFRTQRKEIVRFGYNSMLSNSVKRELEKWDLDESLKQAPDEKRFIELQKLWDI